MKKILTVLFLGLTGISFSQQISLHSQYLFNPMLVNPGATGSLNYIPIQLNYRKQWTNFPGSPTTQSLSAHSAILKNMGFGGTLFNDVAGPSRRTGAELNTAYHLRLDAKKNHYLGLGIGVSVAQHLIDVNQLTTYLPDDPSVTRGYNNQLVPDANFGVFYRYKDKGFAGLSAYNLVQMRSDLYNYETALFNPLKRTYYFFGGYNFDLGKDFVLKTSTLVQGIETSTIQADITVIGVFRNFIWLGASYRHTDAVVGMLGGQAGPFKFGYSYDYTLSDIGKYSNGSHEIFLEVQINRTKGSNDTPWLKRNRIYSPKI